MCLKYFFGSKRKGFHRRVYRSDYNNRRTGKHKKQEMNFVVRRIVKDLRKVFKNGVHEASSPPAMNGHHLKIARKQKKK